MKWRARKTGFRGLPMTPSAGGGGGGGRRAGLGAGAERGGGGEGEDEVRPGAEETAVESAGEEGGVREGARHEAAAEGDVGSADDLDGRRIEGIGLDIGVGTAAADGADGVALGGEAASQIREEMAGGRRVRVEELV